MKKLTGLILSLIAFCSAYSQTGNDTTKYTYYKFTYGEKFNRIWGTNVVDIPTDTTYSKYGIARKGLNIYVGDGTQWANVTGTGGTGVSSFNTRTGSVTSLSSDYSSFYLLKAAIHGTVGRMTYIDQTNSVYQTPIIFDSTNGRLNLSGYNIISGDGSHTWTMTPAFTTFVQTGNSITITPTYFVAGQGAGNLTYITADSSRFNLINASTDGHYAHVWIGQGGTSPGQGQLKLQDGPLVTVPEKGLIEFKNGLAMLTDSIATVIVRDTIATRGWARSAGLGGGGSGIVTSLTTTGTSGPATLVTGVLNIPNYSTGFSDPLTTNGDIIYRNGGTTTRLPKGSNNNVLLTDNLGNVGYNLLTNSNLSGSAGITNANLAAMAGHTYKGNNTGSSAVPADITNTQLTADLNQFTSSLQGLVPASTGTTTDFLRADKTWVKAYQPSDTTATVATKNYVNTLTTVISLRTPGGEAGAVTTAYTNGGVLVIPKSYKIYGVDITPSGVDSALGFSADTTSAHGLVSKDRLAATIAGGGSGVPQGASGDFQWNNGGAFAGNATTWDNTNSVIGISKTQNNEIGSFFSNTNAGTSAGASSTWTNGTQVTKIVQAGKLKNFDIAPDSSGMLYSNAPNLVIYDANAAGEIDLGAGASLTAPQIRLTSANKLKLNPVLLTTPPLDTTNYKLIVRKTGDSALYQMAWPTFGGGSSGLSTQSITSGSSATVTGSNYVVYIDPSSTLSTFALTLPASPSDAQIVIVNFGGTLTSGVIVSSLTVLPNSGQSILDNTPPGSVTADNTLEYRYRASNTKWYRFKP